MGIEFEIEFGKENKAIARQSWLNAATGLVGVALAMGGIFLAATVAAPAAIIGGITLAVLGVGLCVQTYKNEHKVEANYVDLQARKSAADLTQKLEAQPSLNLSPQQQAAIHDIEYDRTKAEWENSRRKEREITI
jgi:hypothetical protein